jgi:hypothetical protein
MRRRLQRFLPIVLIALAVQILAPIGATFAAAIAASDPLNAAPICHGGERPASQDDQGGRTHDGVCAVCCAAQASASLDTPRAAPVAVPYRVAMAVIWHDDASAFVPARAGPHAQARGPPAYS